MAMAMAMTGSTTAEKSPHRLVWNVSGSVPTGLYLVRPASHPTVATLAVAVPPEPLATFLAEGSYLPRGVPLLKPILALRGQTVCRTGLVITIDGCAIGLARERDHRGRPLPAWQGCRVIGEDEVFLMNPDEPASFDGRYFGAIPISALAGRAEPLWTSAQEHRRDGDTAPRCGRHRSSWPASLRRFGKATAAANVANAAPLPDLPPAK